MLYYSITICTTVVIKPGGGNRRIYSKGRIEEGQSNLVQLNRIVSRECARNAPLIIPYVKTSVVLWFSIRIQPRGFHFSRTFLFLHRQLPLFTRDSIFTHNPITLLLGIVYVWSLVSNRYTYQMGLSTKKDFACFIWRGDDVMLAVNGMKEGYCRKRCTKDFRRRRTFACNNPQLRWILMRQQRL